MIAETADLNVSTERLKIWALTAILVFVKSYNNNVDNKSAHGAFFKITFIGQKVGKLNTMYIFFIIFFGNKKPKILNKKAKFGKGHICLL